jgi:N-acetylglucosaminyldiphosphoundecaprenol N-acetyl-beta-D-mannosaminyltransferase
MTAQPERHNGNADTPSHPRARTAARQAHSDGHVPVVRIAGTLVHALTETQCVRLVLDQLDTGCGGWVLTVNLDHLQLFERDRDYASRCAHADLVVADGMPLLWASRLQGTPLPERIAGSNLISSLSAAAAARGRSVFLLGGAPGTADSAAAVLRLRTPALRVAGTCCPPLGFERNREAMAAVTGALGTALPDIVYVGLNKPKQEELIEALRARFPTTWFVGVGISFSFLSGAVPRAPFWMQRVGLEWAHRVAHEPRRLAGRYLRGVLFGVMLLAGAVVRRAQSQP